ncbi:hypothetical protein MPER_04116, partial [Moniliophthora perniciosa FA553]
TFVVDSLPWLKYIPDWFPGAGFKRKAKEWRKLYDNMANIPFEVTKNGMRFFESGNNVGYTEDTIKETAASMYEAGTDTAKAQEELDNVLGPGRLPDFTDKDSLPYCTAIMHEVMRWQPIGPVGQYIMADVIGFARSLLRKVDSTVIPNAW